MSWCLGGKIPVTNFQLKREVSRKLSSLLSSASAQTSVEAIVNSVEPKHEFAGLVGEMMFGPEIEAGSLHNRPYTITGPQKDKIRQEVNKTITSLIKRQNV